MVIPAHAHEHLNIYKEFVPFHCILWSSKPRDIVTTIDDDELNAMCGYHKQHSGICQLVFLSNFSKTCRPSSRRSRNGSHVLASRPRALAVPSRSLWRIIIVLASRFLAPFLCCWRRYRRNAQQEQESQQRNLLMDRAEKKQTRSESSDGHKRKSQWCPSSLK